MKRWTLLVIVGGLVARAANPGDTLRGWSVITWGMTAAEARAAIGPGAADPESPPDPTLELVDRVAVPAVKIGTLTAAAAIQSAPDAPIISAVTLAIGDIHDTPASRSNAFAELKRLLIEKYGSPKDEQSKPGGRGDTVRTALWTFPYTSITLTWLESAPRYALGFVRIRYQSRDPKSLNVL